MERSFLGLGVVTLVLASAIAGTACGSDAASDTNGTSTSSGSSSGTSGSSGSSGTEAVSPIVSGSNGSDGKPGELVSCTFSDSVDFDAATPPTLAVVSQPTGVALFMAGELRAASTSVVRRYLLKSANPCVLERDTTYVGSDVALGISVDAAQRVWGTLPRLARLVPAPRLDCTGAKGIAGAMAIAPSGEHGFARLVDTDAKTERLAHFTSDIGGCVVTALDREPPPGTAWMEIAADHLGRAHVVGVETGTRKLGVRVFDTTGAEVGAYPEPTPAFSANVAITRCFGGTCVQDHDRVLRYDASLKVVKEYARSSSKLARTSIAGDTTGPLFIGGVIGNSANGTAFRVVLDILAAP